MEYNKHSLRRRAALRWEGVFESRHRKRRYVHYLIQWSSRVPNKDERID
jgi:hypothetical protein